MTFATLLNANFAADGRIPSGDRNRARLLTAHMPAQRLGGLAQSFGAEVSVADGQYRYGQSYGGTSP